MLSLNFLVVYLTCFLYHESETIIQPYHKQLRTLSTNNLQNYIAEFNPDFFEQNRKYSGNEIIENDYVLSYSIKLPINSVNANITTACCSQTEQINRKKRGVVQLYNMVSCTTGCKPLSYKGYGCFCGFLGSGYPVDGIDRCCQLHDWCYVAANCPMYFEYFVPYYWKCWNNKPFCARNHHKLGPLNQCATSLCECDRVLSECLSQFSCPMEKTRCTSSPFRLLQNKIMFF